MSFMSGDIKGVVPKSVEAEWISYSQEFTNWSKNTPYWEKDSKENNDIFDKLWPTNSTYIQRIDLTSILTPELIEKIQADREKTQLKMIVIFRDDKVEITAEPYKWR